MASTSASVLAGPPMSYTDGARVDALVERVAAARPDAAALRFQGQETSYADLVREADLVSADLRACGVRAGDIVAVRMARSPRLVAVLLAVLKCDAAYAAVPPDWPTARYEQVVRQAMVRLCVTDAPDTPEVDDVRCVDAADLTGTGRPGGRAASGGGPRDPFCVFFTSGSTGVPKAVLSPHGGVIRVARDCRLGMDGHTIMLQSAPHGWDAAAMELWAPLIHGGTSVLHDSGQVTARDVRDNVDQGLNTIFLTTTLFNALVEDDPDALSGLELVMTGGERASAHHIAEFRRRHPHVRLFHVYGPVEGTIYTTAHEVGSPGSDVPIGTPVSGTTVYVLNTDRRLARPGEAGEIAVAGDGLALAYVGDPDETDARFPTLPVGKDGAPLRVYLTGDLARVDDKGALVFLGRQDRQVKIRGVRVEPGEVERVIEHVSGVGRAAVLALPLDEPRKTHLAAYYTVLDGATVSPGQVRHAVRAALPAAFVPDTALAVRAMPMKPNGKLDDAELAALADRSAGPAVDTVESPAGSPTLRAVLARARELVDGSIGPDTDIFDAGGTSITAIQLAHTMERLSGAKVSVAEVLRARTPAGLATLAGRTRGGTSPAGNPGRWLRGLPTTQYRFWYLERQQPGVPNAIVPLPYRLRGRVDAGALVEALHVVVSWHEALRSRYHPEGKEAREEVVASEAVPPLLQTAPPASAADAEQRAAEFLRRPFELTHDVPVRALLVPGVDSGGLLALAFHHIAVDAWSLRLFTQDLSTAYQVLKSGRRMPRREPSRFTEVWRAQAARETPEDQDVLNAWTDGVAGVPDLPLGGPGQLAPTAAAGERWIDLPGDLAGAAERRAAEVCGGTAVAVLLAAWVRALRAFTAATDFALGMPVAGRTIPEAELTIGCFTSAVIARFTGTADADADDDIRAAARELTMALRFQYMPIERVVFRDPPPDTGRNPFCQAGFVVQNTQPARLRLDGVTYEREYPPRDRSAYELTLEVWWSPRLTARLWYRTDVLATADAARLASIWRAGVLTLAGLHPADARGTTT